MIRKKRPLSCGGRVDSAAPGAVGPWPLSDDHGGPLPDESTVTNGDGIVQPSFLRTQGKIGRKSGKRCQCARSWLRVASHCETRTSSSRQPKLPGARQTSDSRPTLLVRKPKRGPTISPSKYVVSLRGASSQPPPS